MVVPATTGASHSWEPLLAKLRREPGLADGTDANWHYWDHGSHWCSFAHAADLSRQLREELDLLWVTCEGLDDIILIGHCMGGLLIRQAYLEALGIGFTERLHSPWAERVSRIVLIATPNRGFSKISPSRNVLWLAPLAWLIRAIPMDRLIRFLPPVRSLLVSDIMRGSAFVTNLRIEWIRYFFEYPRSAPTIVQMLGSDDTAVVREDSIDLRQLPHARQMSVPGAGHADIFRIDRARDPDARYALIRSAILDSKPGVAYQVSCDSTNRGELVVFVLHGIRSTNRTWVRQLEEILRQRRPSVIPIVLTYGFFSAIQFALPPTRRRNLGWFQHEYSEQLSRNPSAEFIFIGHSNATYVFGQSLVEVPGIKFTRAVLAGSVLPENYDWRTIMRRGQLLRLYNLRANRDFPVSFLVSGLRGLGMRDIGPSGYVGFSCAEPHFKEELFWYDGGHNSPVESHHLGSLADFALQPDTLRPTRLVEREFTRTFAAFPRLAPWIFRLGLGSTAVAAAWWIGSDLHLLRLAVLGMIVVLVAIVLDLL